MTDEEFLELYLRRFGNPLAVSREVLLSQRDDGMEEYLRGCNAAQGSPNQPPESAA